MPATRWARPALLLAALGSLALSGTARAGSSAIETLGAPSGFSDLEQPHELLVDVYFGNRKVGDAWIIARPGFVKFKDPGQLFKLLPELEASPELSVRLSSELPDHSALACTLSSGPGCGRLETELFDIIFNEDRFRIDLFVNPRDLGVADSGDAYLPSPKAALSLTSSVGGALSGATSGKTNYNFQNRTIIGFRNARIRTNNAYASDLGFIVDDLVAEVDSTRHRSSAGLFWAPGIDFTGRRRIAGLGFSTQFDTRADQDSLEATPLILFLSQPSRVEILIDGRLVTSASYEAGNRLVDSTSLPSGSYPLILRIQGPDGSIREERRFFVKNAQVAPPGKPIYFAYAGLLSKTRENRPISLSNDFYYQAGAAYRLRQSLALDGSIIGTQHKAIAQLGGWLITDAIRLRAAGLVSSDGDTGALLQLGSAGFGTLNFNFDLRRVWSRKGDPLIPLASNIDNFSSVPPIGGQALSGSYTQAIGSMTYSLGGAFLSLTGSYRHDRGTKADYSIGPGLTWPVLNRGGFQLLLNADAQMSRRTTAAFAGVRLLYTNGGASLVTTSGYGTIRDRDGGRKEGRAVGGLSAQWFHEDGNRTQVALEGSVQRDVETTTARAIANVASQLGSARAEVLHGLEGRGGTQYGLNFQTGIAMGSSTLELGGRDLNQSAVIVALAGSARQASFDILIDDVPRARIKTGSSVPVFLEAYRSYTFRLRPIDALPLAYDTGPRTVTLYPGTVEKLRWTVERLVTVFGQLAGPDGSVIANAPITLPRGIGQTDDHGYFQIDAAPGDVLQVQINAQEACKVALASFDPGSDYARLGKVICQ